MEFGGDEAREESDLRVVTEAWRWTEEGEESGK